jgi:hypothetical protein
MLSTFFKTEYPDYKIDFSQFLSPILAKKLINDGGIKVLTLRRYELPKDVIDYLGITHGKETDSYTIELKLTANNDTLININNKAAKFASNPNNSFIEAPLMSKLGLTENTDTSITVLDGKHTRTIDLSDNMQLRPYYDIDTKVDKVKGHPVFASIDKLSKELITDVSSEMYPTEKAAKKSTA